MMIIRQALLLTLLDPILDYTVSNGAVVGIFLPGPAVRHLGAAASLMKQISSLGFDSLSHQLRSKLWPANEEKGSLHTVTERSEGRGVTGMVIN